MEPEREQQRYEELEARLADALRRPDPGRALAELARDPELGPAVARAHEDGFRIAALLVARLRFERLMHGSRAAGEEFRADGKRFAERFRRYHAAVPPRAVTPFAEAADYADWSAADAPRTSG